MLLATDLYNKMRKSLIKEEKLVIENITNSISFNRNKKEKLYLAFCTFLGEFERIHIYTNNNGINIEAYPKKQNLTDGLRKQADYEIINYELERNRLTKEQENNRYLEEEYEYNEPNLSDIKKPFEIEKINTIVLAHASLNFKFNLFFSDEILKLSKESSDITLDKEEISMLSYNLQKFDFITLVPVYKDEVNEKELIGIRFNFGFNK